ncbi:unnamed protein product [Orchesella dallaii]|uniref:Uncharacterized protein n=1 Tax=Orchesella dallaii TaxID=48710 RepID=A0ABP1R4E5_9HEXA
MWDLTPDQLDAFQRVLRRKFDHYIDRIQYPALRIAGTKGIYNALRRRAAVQAALQRLLNTLRGRVRRHLANHCKFPDLATYDEFGSRMRDFFREFIIAFSDICRPTREEKVYDPIYGLWQTIVARMEAFCRRLSDDAIFPILGEDFPSRFSDATVLEYIRRG